MKGDEKEFHFRHLFYVHLPKCKASSSSFLEKVHAVDARNQVFMVLGVFSICRWSKKK